MTQITVEQFDQVEMRVGRIVAAEPFPAARKPAYKLTIDFGSFGLKRSSAQLTELYTPDDLVGRLIVAATNSPPRRSAGCPSGVLVMGAPAAGVERANPVLLLQPDRDVELGARVF